MQISCSMSFLRPLALLTVLGHALSSTLLRRTRLQPDANDTVSLKGLRIDSPAAETDLGDQQALQGSLPVFLPSDDPKQLVERHFTYNFSSQEVSDLNYSRSHGNSGALCTPLNTVFDVGFYDGADSRTYLTGGYCVVGIEADPDLVALAMQHFAVFVSTGQLKIANVAISPVGEPQAWTVFYRSRCNKEWNSFYKQVGCRACLPPHGVDMNACEQFPVTSTDCSGIFAQFGVPHYLKLDIEGAETGCFQALKRLPAGTTLPHFISAEITQLDYIDHLYNLGYRGFKLVRQDRLVSATGSQSGPWGDNALDCRTGPWWRDVTATRAEMTAIIAKDFDVADPCSGGLMPIHETPKLRTQYVWYDIHATLTKPPAAQ